MSTVGVPDGSPIELLGSINAQPEPGYREPLQVSVAATTNAEDGAGLQAELVKDELRLVDGEGGAQVVTLTSHSLVPSIDGRYEIHSGVVTEDEGAADVFAICGLALAACLALYAGQFWLIKRTLDDYRGQRLVPQNRTKSGLFNVVTCRFDIDMTALGTDGRVVRSERVRVGRGK